MFGIVFLAQGKFPFPNLKEDNFYKTILGKKIKFLTITKKEKQPKRANNY